jgi:uncharacterized protein YraI
MASKIKVIILLVVIGLISRQAMIRAQASLQGRATVTANVRIKPDRNATIVASITEGTVVTVEARNADSSWLVVRLQSQKRGWASARQIDVSGDIASLAVSSDVFSLTDQPAPVTNNSSNATANDQTPGGSTSISSNNSSNSNNPNIETPDPKFGYIGYAAKITPKIRSAMQAVYRRGLARGNNSRIFSRIGDCLVGHVWFLYQFGGGQFYDLGQYGYLQNVISNFMVSPRPGVANPFVTIGQAAHGAFTSAAVLDPVWADQSICKNDESPLKCEFRTSKPSVAFVMFGVVDVQAMSAGQFNTYLRQVIEQTLAQGVIPIMTTAPENPAFAVKAHQFNGIVISVASQYNVPLINLRDAIWHMPNHGLHADGIHLSPGEGFVHADLVSLPDGFSVWNLLALQSLDNVWKQIMQ